MISHELSRSQDTTVQGYSRAFSNIAQSQVDAPIIAAKLDVKYRVIAFHVQTGGVATNINFNSKPAGVGVAISMIYQNAINGGSVPGYNPAGWFETEFGEGLTATTGGGSTTGVQVVYTEIRSQGA